MTIDGSWPQSVEVLRSAGFNLHEATKGPGSIVAGIDFLLEHELVIDPSCDHLIREMNSYSWPTSRLTGKVVSKAKPVGADDHVLDSLRYAVETLNPNLLLADDDNAGWDPGFFHVRLWPPTPHPFESPWHDVLRRRN
jgi:phage terminase large subunit